MSLQIVVACQYTDEEKYAKQIHDILGSSFGEANIYLIPDDVPFRPNYTVGEEWKKIKSYDVLVVIIGKNWITNDQGVLKWAISATDQLFLTTKYFLSQQGKIVVPILLDGLENLPDQPRGLKKLRDRKALKIQDNPESEEKLKKLPEQIQKIERRQKRTVFIGIGVIIGLIPSLLTNAANISQIAALILQISGFPLEITPTQSPGPFPIPPEITETAGIPPGPTPITVCDLFPNLPECVPTSVQSP